MIIKKDRLNILVLLFSLVLLLTTQFFTACKIEPPDKPTKDKTDKPKDDTSKNTLGDKQLKIHMLDR
jgi:hypothetical protein